MVDVGQAIDLRLNHGLSYGKIAALQGVSKQAIHSKLKMLLPNLQKTLSFIDHRADILAASQLRLIEALSDLDRAETKDLVKRRGMVDFGILHDKERIERGLSGNDSHPLVQINIVSPNAQVVAQPASPKAVEQITINDNKDIQANV